MIFLTTLCPLPDCNQLRQEHGAKVIRVLNHREVAQPLHDPEATVLDERGNAGGILGRGGVVEIAGEKVDRQGGLAERLTD